MNAKPIVRTGVVTEFGEVLDESELFDTPGGMEGDLTYVPGFSDMRRAHDLALAEGKTPTPLPVNLRWVRRQNSKGQPDTKRQVLVGNQGYTTVSAEEVGKQDWLTAFPPGSHALPDGGIGNADWVLMVADAKTAARNAVRKRVRMLERSTGSLPAALEEAGLRVPGANPEVTRELAPERR